MIGQAEKQESRSLTLLVTIWGLNLFLEFLLLEKKKSFILLNEYTYNLLLTDESNSKWVCVLILSLIFKISIMRITSQRRLRNLYCNL